MRGHKSRRLSEDGIRSWLCRLHQLNDSRAECLWAHFRAANADISLKLEAYNRMGCIVFESERKHSHLGLCLIIKGIKGDLPLIKTACFARSPTFSV